MKNIILAIMMLLFSGAAYAESSISSQSVPAIPAESTAAAALSGVKQAERQYICMVTNKAFDKPQIPVKIGEKTYYGCCEMCKEKLEKDAQLRQAVDPVTGKSIDKASAVIGVTEDGSVHYFETKDNLEKFNKGEEK